MALPARKLPSLTERFFSQPAGAAAEAKERRARLHEERAAAVRSYGAARAGEQSL